ncbi:alpha/beta hydrolase [Sphingomonas sp.]|uniref:alpha/beta hydrolase n=1 Tax=Sphingomonas sp. TaxID=28214 RepID=UPI001EBBB20D|nr:alpha/beta hydrolase [Sphingomonas sp.]MBX3595030.1 alpha/beta hydrolase [Sphingomonas sp.]
MNDGNRNEPAVRKPDPEVERLLARMAQGGPPYDELGVDAARAQIDAQGDPGHYAQVGQVEDRTIPGPAGPVPIRIYRPVTRECAATTLYFHGGGWVIGGIGSHDNACRRLCAGAGCTVIAIDYRLAPEHPFPAAYDDCRAVLDWAASKIGQGESLVLAGDSAGGNLAAALALGARDDHLPIALQLLIYPIVQIDADTPSMARNADGYGLTRKMMMWFYDHYCPVEARGDWRASPLLASDHMGAAPAHIIVAGFDPLHDEGVAYAMKLIAAGVPTTLSSYPGQIHGFYAMTRFLADGRRAQAEAIDAIRRATTADPRWSRDGFAPEAA